MATIIHTMSGNFCTVCNETREWLTDRGAATVEAVEATDFALGDIVRIGKGQRRWLVTNIWEDGRIALSKVAAKGERSHTLGVSPGIRFDGLKPGNDHRYFDAGEQDVLTQVGKAQPVA